MLFRSPGKEVYIKRPKKVKVVAQNRWGEEMVLEDEKLFSRVLQHEIDHLDGELFVDYLAEAKRQRIRRRLIKDRRLQAVGA